MTKDEAQAAINRILAEYEKESGHCVVGLSMSITSIGVIEDPSLSVATAVIESVARENNWRC